MFWRWYAALLIANTFDLLFTYTAVERGIEEWNPLIRPVLLTPWPIFVKLVAFGLLAYGLWQTLRRVQRPGRILPLLQSATVIYLLVIAIHIVGLYVRPE